MINIFLNKVEGLKQLVEIKENFKAAFKYLVSEVVMLVITAIVILLYNYFIADDSSEIIFILSGMLLMAAYLKITEIIGLKKIIKYIDLTKILDDLKLEGVDSDFDRKNFPISQSEIYGYLKYAIFGLILGIIYFLVKKYYPIFSISGFSIKLYISISFFMGLIMIFESIMILKNNGEYLANKVVLVTSSIEVLWLVSVICLLITKSFSGWLLVIAYIHIFFNGFGFYYLLEIKKLKTRKVMIIPSSILKIMLFYGVYYVISNLMLFIFFL